MGMFSVKQSEFQELFLQHNRELFQPLFSKYGKSLSDAEMEYMNNTHVALEPYSCPGLPRDSIYMPSQGADDRLRDKKREARETLRRELEEALVCLELEDKEEARLIRKINSFLGW